MGKFLLSVLGLLLITYQQVIASRILQGPTNITRTDGEENIFIPCPFVERFNPVWKVNDTYYESFNLPQNMVSSIFGLRIKYVSKTLNGTTFQCHVSTGIGFEVLSSTIGKLTVIKRDNNSTQLITVNRTFDLDHQHVFFKRSNKTFTWKRRPSTCDIISYKIISTTCGDSESPVKTWYTQRDSISINSRDLLNGNPPNSLFLQLDAINSVGEVCEYIIPYLVVESTDITLEKKVSYDKFCLKINASESSHPSIALPTNSTYEDCICPIVFVGERSCFNFSHCHCFSTSVVEPTACKILEENTTAIDVCFAKFSSMMNNTVLHFFESYAYCLDQHGHHNVKPHRKYIASFKILIVLPNEPSIIINTESGELSYLSENNKDIQIVYYRLIVRDRTNQTLINLTTVESNYSVGDLFQSIQCSPYYITVQANNAHGYTASTSNTHQSGQSGDICLCVEHNIPIDQDTITATFHEGQLYVYVNCSQVSYSSEILLRVSAVSMEENMYVTIRCSVRDRGTAVFASINCDQIYTILVHWINPYTTEVQCVLKEIQLSLLTKTTCSESNRVLLITMMFILLLSITLVTIIIIILEIKRRSLKKRLQTFELR